MGRLALRDKPVLLFMVIYPPHSELAIETDRYAPSYVMYRVIEGEWPGSSPSQGSIVIAKWELNIEQFGNSLGPSSPKYELIVKITNVGR